MVSLVPLFLTTIIGICLLVYLYFKLIIFTYWKRNGIFQYPQTFPFGMALPLFWERQHMGDFFRDIYTKMKSEDRKYAGFYLLTKPMILITDPEDVKHVLAKDFSHFRSRGVWCDEEIDPLSANLFCLPPDKWRSIRSKLSPFFTPMKMKFIFPTMEACGSSLIEVVGEFSDRKECFDMKDVIWRFTTLIMGSCVFGYECNTMQNPNDQVKLVGQEIFEPEFKHAWKRPLFFLMPQVLKFLKVSSNSQFITHFFQNLVKDSMKYRDENKVTRADLMQILIDLRKRGDDDGLTINEMAAQCWVFFAGGFDTAAALVSYCLYELSINKEIQNNVRKEILEVLKNYEGKFTFEALHDMKYTEKVIKETLRKYPALPFLNRECTSDSYTFPNSKITLRKGDAVAISVYGLQRDPDYYPDPDKFDPERFNDDKYVNPYTYLPFGEGPRNCIGLRMGQIQGKLTVALLLSKFKFLFNETKTKLPFHLSKNSFTFLVEGGIWLEAERV